MKPLLPVLLLTLMGNVTNARAAVPFSVTYLAVGQGDAALYRGPCGQVGLIDANRGSVSRILSALDSAGSRQLRWISPSHYDADHLGDVVDVASAPGVSVQSVYDRGGNRNAKDTATYRDYYDWVTGSGKRIPVDIGARFSLCTGENEVLFTVLSAGTDGSAAGGIPVSEENDRGLCLHVEYRSFDLATCGDINGTSEGSRSDVETAVAPVFGDVEFAHINHHGSRFSSNPAYVSTLSAQASLVSVGNNPYGHPNPEVLTRWRSVGEVFQTQSSDGSLLDGDVTVTTDGLSGFSVSTTASGKARSYALDDSVCLVSTSLVVAVAPSVVTYGKSVAVHGQFTTKSGLPLSGQELVLERRSHGQKTFEPMASSVTDSAGLIVVKAKPARNADFRLRFAGAGCLGAGSSPVTSVGVRPRMSADVSPSRVDVGSLARITVIVWPAHPGQRMKLQRYMNGRWRTVQVRVMRRAFLRFLVRPLVPGLIQYRASKARDKDHLSSRSRIIRLRVTEQSL